VGGFIFLRYLCPALVTPEQFGIAGGELPFFSPLYLNTKFISKKLRFQEVGLVKIEEFWF
jgi:hypothetical protein